MEVAEKVNNEGSPNVNENLNPANGEKAATVVAAAKNGKKEMSAYELSQQKELADLLEFRQNAERRTFTDAELVEMGKTTGVTFEEMGKLSKSLRQKSPEVFKMWAPVFEITEAKDGGPDIPRFCTKIYNLLPDEIRMKKTRNPNEFMTYASAAKAGCDAAIGCESLERWLKGNKDTLFPEFAPVKDVALENLKKLDKAVDIILDCEFLPKTRYVEIDENGNIVEGAKPVTMLNIVNNFYRTAIEPKLPKKGDTEKGAEETAKAEAAEGGEEKPAVNE